MSDIASRLRLQREQNAARAAIAELTAQGERLLSAYQQSVEVKYEDDDWERASAQVDVVKKAAGVTPLLWLAAAGKNAAAIIMLLQLAIERAPKCTKAARLYGALSRSLINTSATVCKQPRIELSKHQNEQEMEQTQQLLLQDMQQRGTAKSREQALSTAQGTLRAVLLAALRSGTLQRSSKLLSCSAVQLWPFCNWPQQCDIVREKVAVHRSAVMRICMPGVAQGPDAPMDMGMMSRMLMIVDSVAELIEASAYVHKHAAAASSSSSNSGDSGGSGVGGDSGGGSGSRQAGAEGHRQDANTRSNSSNNDSSGRPATTTSLSAELQSQLPSSGLLEHWSRLLLMMASSRPPESMADWVRDKCTATLARCTRALRSLGLDCSAQLLRPWQDSGPLQYLLSSHVVAMCHALDRAGTCGLPEGAPCLPLIDTRGSLVDGGDRQSRPAVDVSLVLVALDSWAAAGRRAAAGESFGGGAVEGAPVRGSQGPEAEGEQQAAGGGGEEGSREGGGGPGTSADAGEVERRWWSWGRGCKKVLDLEVLAGVLIRKEAEWWGHVVEAAVKRRGGGGEEDAERTATLEELHSSLQAEGSNKLAVTNDSEAAAALQGVHMPGRLASHLLCIRLLYGALSVIDMLEPSAMSSKRALMLADPEADNARRVKAAADGGLTGPGGLVDGPPGVSFERGEAEALVVAALRCDREALRPEWSRALRREGGVWPHRMRRLAAWWRAVLAAMKAGVRVGRLGSGGGGLVAAEPLPLFPGGELTGG